MSKKRKREYQWHDGFFRFVLNRDRDCVVDLTKLAVQDGDLTTLQGLFALVDWRKSEQATDAFFEKGGGRITFADLVYRLYLVGTDYYFYLLAEHKDNLVGGYRPFMQMDGYATRIRERDRGKLVLSLLLIGSGDAPKHSNYVDAVLDGIAVPEPMRAALKQCKESFATHEQLPVTLSRVPEAALLDGKTFACPAVFYAIKHNKKLNRARVSTLLSLCREMQAKGKDVVVAGILWYAIPASGLGVEEWLAIEMDDCPHLAEEELVMSKREFVLETLEREVAEGRAEGEARGEARGRAKGKAEGLAASRREIAKRMLTAEMSDADIQRLTKLSQRELALLKQAAKL